MQAGARKHVKPVGAKWLLADLPETPVCVPSTPAIPTRNLEHAENSSTLQGENKRRREDERSVVEASWWQSYAMDFQRIIHTCGHDLRRWGVDYFRRFGRKVQHLRDRMEFLKNSRAPGDVLLFHATEEELRVVLTQEELYWRQRSKQLWLKEGDQNTKFFHRFASQRRKSNQLIKLRSHTGNGVETLVWGVPWLADTGDPKLVTPCVDELRTIHVCNLLDEHGKWDIDLLRDIFVEQDISRIMNTPISPEYPDSWAWKGDIKVLVCAWSPPPLGMLKCNVDASILNWHVGAGAVLRDHAGRPRMKALEGLREGYLFARHEIATSD
nr:uncharacterized protein LOC109179546 [Ipomoea batatas]